MFSNCTTSAGENCFCGESNNPTCKLALPEYVKRLEKQPSPSNSKRSISHAIEQLKRQVQPDGSIIEELKKLQVSDGCKKVLQDPYSLLCIRELGSMGQLQNPLLTFAFSNSTADQGCRDFWAKWSCCNVCLQSALDGVTDLEMTDLVASTLHIDLIIFYFGFTILLGGLPGLSCSVDAVSLEPQVGTINDTCVIGPLVPLESRAFYRDQYCAGDFLANFIDTNPFQYGNRNADDGGVGTYQGPNAKNTTRSSASALAVPLMAVVALSVLNIAVKFF